MLEIRVAEGGQVQLAGRLDATQADHAMRVLDGVKQSIVVDLAELEYISSAGLAVLLRTFKRLRRDGHELRLVNLAPRVRSIFEYAGFDRLLRIE